jgi:hypothetical protein
MSYNPLLSDLGTKTSTRAETALLDLGINQVIELGADDEGRNTDECRDIGHKTVRQADGLDPRSSPSTRAVSPRQARHVGSMPVRQAPAQRRDVTSVG